MNNVPHSQLGVAFALALSGCGSLEAPPPDVLFDRSEIDASTATDIGLDGFRDATSDVRLDAPDARVDAAGDVSLDAGDAGAVTTAAQCQARLTALGVTWRTASASQGVAWPITVVPPINGVRFRGTSFTGTVNTSLFMDCRLGIALDTLTRQLRDRWQMVEIMHLGIYNYRCIAGTDPCVLSQHSFGNAIDLGGFVDTNGVQYSVATDFVMNGRPTCPARPMGTKDTVLKDIACWMYDNRVFNIILTPNYNADHRDHFHVDLTVGSHFIGLGRPDSLDPDPADPWTWLVDDH